MRGASPLDSVGGAMADTGQTRTGTARLESDGILRFRCFPGAALTEDDARANVEACIAASEGRLRPCIVDMSQVLGIDRSARRYHSSYEHSGRHYLAIALLVGSPLSRVIGNFFVGLNRSTFPLRLFTSEEEAIAWLRTFLE